MIRLAIIDDQTLVRRGIRSLLEMTHDMQVVAEAGGRQDAVRVIRETRPDVVLLDVRMPDGNGIDVLNELNATDDLPPTILLTTFDDDDALFDGVKAGARGYFLKDVSLEDLTAAIRVVAQGGSAIRPIVTERMLRGLDHLPRGFAGLQPPESLTKRELQVVRLMAGGYSNREIADALGTSAGTVKNHVSSILSKFGVRDRTRAVLLALERGCI